MFNVYILPTYKLEMLSGLLHDVLKRPEEDISHSVFLNNIIHFPLPIPSCQTSNVQKFKSIG
jgi:hypothetical protein